MKSFCRDRDARISDASEAGYSRAALLGMARYLRRPVFKEFDPEQKQGRFQSDKRVFCILTAKDYSFFVEKKGLNLYIMDQHLRFAMRMGTLTNAGSSPEDELLLVSSRPHYKTKSVEASPAS
jgi:hypothetical protein